MLTNRFIACMTRNDGSRDVPETEGASRVLEWATSARSKPAHVSPASPTTFHLQRNINDACVHGGMVVRQPTKDNGPAKRQPV